MREGLARYAAKNGLSNVIIGRFVISTSYVDNDDDTILCGRLKFRWSGRRRLFVADARFIM
jgi:hypothetical protein